MSTVTGLQTHLSAEIVIDTATGEAQIVLHPYKSDASELAGVTAEMEGAITLTPEQVQQAIKTATVSIKPYF